MSQENCLVMVTPADVPEPNPGNHLDLQTTPKPRTERQTLSAEVTNRDRGMRGGPLRLLWHPGMKAIFAALTRHWRQAPLLRGSLIETCEYDCAGRKDGGSAHRSAYRGTQPRQSPA